MRKDNPSQDAVPFVCPKTGRWIAVRAKTRWAAWLLLPAAGLVSLAWFLVRVIPKPSRAMYPCQRMAFPIASGFVAWLVGLVATVVAFRKARELGRQHRALLAVACSVVAVLAGVYTLVNVPAKPAAAAPSPHAPLGTAKGIYPGRVVLVHDPKATSWAGYSDGYWWQSNHTDQATVDAMLSVAIRTIGGRESDQAAWDAIFRHFNSTHGRGDVGYSPSEKILIKCNNVGQIGHSGWVNPTTYDQTAEQNVISVAPQMMLAVLRQLINKAGVPQANISIGDTVCYFVNHQWNICHSEFPNVKYLDIEGKLGRTKAVPSDHPLYWSKPGVNPQYTDHSPLAAAEATYFISLPHLKAHEGGGVTLSGKNLYGGLCRYPYATGYFELHGDLPYSTLGMGKYRTFVDLLGHADFGGKGLLWLMDGLWTGTDATTYPQRWYKLPFNGDWPSCLLASQDPMALDSVGFDMCYMEWPTGYPGTVVGADDYLHEGALAPNPPSGTFYDPERDGTALQSLGVHEHWNNSTARQYSRNLGTGNGIELLWYDVGDPGDTNGDKSVDVVDLLSVVTTFGLSRGQAGFDQKVDLNFSGRIDIGDLLAVINNFGATY